MKAIKLIALAFLTVLAVGTIMVITSCDKQDTEIEEPYYDWEQARKEGKALLRSSYEQPGKGLPTGIMGKANIMAKAIGISNGRKWAIVEVKANISPSTFPISSISMIIDYDETKMYAQPFDYSSLHPQLTASLASGQGGVFGSRVGGRFYLCYFSITPMMFTPSAGSYIIFKMVFEDIQSPAFVNFDLTSPWNCEFSPDGWNAIPFIWTGTTL